MPLKLTWVNHASFILSDGTTTLITDPWLEGTAFNDSWKLLSPTVLPYDEFKNITHIWFSHEHPDHFAPLVVKKIPAQYRQNITVLYQSTIDRKVAEFCKKQGFKSIVEIPPGSKINLSTSIKISCQKVKNDVDSWLLIETPEMRILNLNDCHFQGNRTTLEKLKNTVGDIDLMLTQFSYAGWVGNRAEGEAQRKYAKEQLEEMRIQIEILNPKMVIPFASYIWFCHEENYYLNKNVNKVRDVYNIIPTWGNYTPLVFYPGDVWNMNEKWNGSEGAIARYEKDFNKIMMAPDLIKSERVDLAELKKAGEECRQRCIKDNNVKKVLSFPAFTIYLTDYSRSFRYSYHNGLEEAGVKEEDADVSLASQALWYSLKNNWGFATLNVSGRFEKPANGNFNRVEIYQWVGDLKNRGKKVPYLLERIGTKLKEALVKG